jgi:ubiquitin-protein ligase
VDESLDRLEADILGPDSSPYRGRIFRLSISIPDR